MVAAKHGTGVLLKVIGAMYYVSELGQGCQDGSACRPVFGDYGTVSRYSVDVLWMGCNAMLMEDTPVFDVGYSAALKGERRHSTGHEGYMGW